MGRTAEMVLGMLGGYLEYLEGCLRYSSVD
jgi:hypothetical protein